MPRIADQDPRYVLLVDGDVEQAQAMSAFFSVRGIDINHAQDVQEARELIATTTFDQVVLDASRDHRGGMRLLSELSAVPDLSILMISHLASVPDRIQGLEQGADDYLAKPYDPHELLARMRAVYRRCRRLSESRTWRQKAVAFEDWSLDLNTRWATHSSGQRAELTAGEFHLLRVLLEHAGEVLTRERLAALTHRDSGQVFHRSIDVLVGRLRKKLELVPDGPPLIQTVRGEGYRVTTAVTWL